MARPNPLYGTGTFRRRIRVHAKPREVTVELEDGTERTYRLVGPDETEPSAGAISVDAPLGRALLGKKDGEVVAVVRPAGLVELTVVEVRWTRPAEE